MKQLIIRIINSSADAEILVSDSYGEYFKKIDLKSIEQIIHKNTYNENFKSLPRLIDKSVIAQATGVVVIKKPAHKRIVTFEKKAYNINFPNALYVIRHDDDKVKRIDAYTYFVWKELETDLYAMPMPNMTMSENMCIGTADRSIKKGNINTTLEKIIDAEYTHSHVDNLKAKTSTLNWFRYLTKHKVQEADVRKSITKLKKIVEK